MVGRNGPSQLWLKHLLGGRIHNFLANKVPQKKRAKQHKAAAEDPVSPVYIVPLGERNIADAKKGLWVDLKSKVRIPKIDTVKSIVDQDKILVKARDPNTSKALQELLKLGKLKQAKARKPKVLIRNVGRDLTEDQVIALLTDQNDIVDIQDHVRLAYR